MKGRTYNSYKLSVRTNIQWRDQGVIMTGVFCVTSVGKHFMFPL